MKAYIRPEIHIISKRTADFIMFNYYSKEGEEQLSKPNLQFEAEEEEFENEELIYKTHKTLWEE